MQSGLRNVAVFHTKNQPLGASPRFFVPYSKCVFANRTQTRAG